MKIAYHDPESRNFHAKTRKLIEEIDKITQEYMANNYTLTVRQTYYVLFSKKLLPNNKSNYNSISTIIKNGRLYGLLDWDAFEDRIRIPKKHTEWDNIYHLMDSALSSYRIDRHSEQENYIEVWVEKDALVGVLEPITDQYNLTLMSNRGFSSTTAIRDSALRFKDATEKGKNCIILYMGDHDPSGKNMIGDIQKRQKIFGADVEMKAIALTKEQIEKYDLPPDPAKTKDPRLKEYSLEHGKVSWELDALPPKILNEILIENIKELIDMDSYNEVIEYEELEKNKLIKIMEKMDFDEQSKY